LQEQIDEEKLHTFEQKLSRWQNEIGVTDQAIIDSLLEDLGNILQRFCQENVWNI
jgi:hypothetical protein